MTAVNKIWPAKTDVLLLLLFIACCFFLNRPYLGVFHDGVLYALEALYRNGESQFANDMIISHGGQGKYTIFVPIWSAIIDAMGLAISAFILTFVGMVLWISAFFWLGLILWRAKLFDDFLVLFAAGLCVVLMPSGYGGYFVFHYAEAIPTPRLFAEALVLFAIGLALQKQGFWSIFAIAACAIFHPITAISGALFVWLLLLRLNRQYLWLLPIFLSLLLLASYFEKGPFVYLLQKAEADWFEMAQIRNPYSFPTRWLENDWVRLLFDVAILVLFIWRTNGTACVVGGIALAVSAFGFLLSLIAVEYFQSAFLMMLQPWRALWLLHIFSILALAVMVFKLIRLGEIGWLVISLFLFARLNFFDLLISLPILVFASVLAVILFLWIDKTARIPRPKYRLVALLALFLALGTLHNFALLNYSSLFEVLSVQIIHWSLLRAIVGVKLLWLLLFLFAGLFWIFRRNRYVTTAIVFTMTTLTLLQWDQRSIESRYHDGTLTASPPFAGFLQKNDLIFWPGNEETAWLLARQPLYMTAAHGAAATLFKQQALEYRARLPLVAAFGGRMNYFPDIARIIGWPISRPNGRNALIHMCRKAPKLKKVILERNLGGANAIWIPPFVRNRDIATGSVDRAVVQTYYLYDCDPLRKLSL